MTCYGRYFLRQGFLTREEGCVASGSVCVCVKGVCCYGLN